MRIKQSNTPSTMKWSDVPPGHVVRIKDWEGTWMKLSTNKAVDLEDGATHDFPANQSVEFYYPHATVELGDAA
jgi:hypothetical protein